MPVYGLRGKGCKWQIVQCLLRGLPVQCPSRAFPSPRLCRGSWLLGVSSFFLKNAELLPSPRRSFASIWHGEKARIQEKTGDFQRNAFWEPTMPFWVKPSRSHPSGYTKTIRIPFVKTDEACWQFAQRMELIFVALIFIGATFFLLGGICDSLWFVLVCLQPIITGGKYTFWRRQKMLKSCQILAKIDFSKTRGKICFILKWVISKSARRTSFMN